MCGGAVLSDLIPCRYGGRPSSSLQRSKGFVEASDLWPELAGKKRARLHEKKKETKTWRSSRAPDRMTTPTGSTAEAEEDAGLPKCLQEIEACMKFLDEMPYQEEIYGGGVGGGGGGAPLPSYLGMQQDAPLQLRSFDDALPLF